MSEIGAVPWSPFSTETVTQPCLVLRQPRFLGAPETHEIVDMQVIRAGVIAPGQLEAYAANRGISNCLLYAIPVAAFASV